MLSGMTDWKSLAEAAGVNLPPEQITKITPTLQALEEAFGKLKAALPDDAQPAVQFFLPLP